MQVAVTLAGQHAVRTGNMLGAGRISSPKQPSPPHKTSKAATEGPHACMLPSACNCQPRMQSRAPPKVAHLRMHIKRAPHSSANSLSTADRADTGTTCIPDDSAQAVPQLPCNPPVRAQYVCMGLQLAGTHAMPRSLNTSIVTDTNTCRAHFFSTQCSPNGLLCAV